jgi:hypothetical protein
MAMGKSGFLPRLNRNSTQRRGMMSTQAPDVPLPVALWQMVKGYWISQSIYVVAKLGIADLLKDGPKSYEELAQATGTHTQSLYRLLRGLASVGYSLKVRMTALT